MREIKFRAWDKQKKRMLVVYRISFDGPIEGAQVHCYLDDRGLEGSTEYSYDGDGLILEQFTGLADVNCKEIYEGDVVRYTAWHDGKPSGAIQGEVVYDGDLGMALFNILLDRDGEIDRAVLPAIGVEIMGNVHENPELLEVE